MLKGEDPFLRIFGTEAFLLLHVKNSKLMNILLCSRGSRQPTVLHSFNHQSLFQSVEPCRYSATTMSMLHQKTQARQSSYKYIKYLTLTNIDPVTVEANCQKFSLMKGKII